MLDNNGKGALMQRSHGMGWGYGLRLVDQLAIRFTETDRSLEESYENKKILRQNGIN